MASGVLVGGPIAIGLAIQLASAMGIWLHGNALIATMLILPLGFALLFGRRVLRTQEPERRRLYTIVLAVMVLALLGAALISPLAFSAVLIFMTPALAAAWGDSITAHHREQGTVKVEVNQRTRMLTIDRKKIPFSEVRGVELKGRELCIRLAERDLMVGHAQRKGGWDPLVKALELIVGSVPNTSDEELARQDAERQLGGIRHKSFR